MGIQVFYKTEIQYQYNKFKLASPLSEKVKVGISFLIYQQQQFIYDF